MRLKGMSDEDFVNYSKPSMFLITPFCDFKCDKESGIQCCQNSSLATSPIINVPINTIVNRYISNDITKAIVIGGLEPLIDNYFIELLDLVAALRKCTEDDIVIYTGYNKDEVEDKVEQLARFKNIIIKFGRFIPNDESRFDEVLGVNLASHNQYAEKIS